MVVTLRRVTKCGIVGCHDKANYGTKYNEKLLCKYHGYNKANIRYHLHNCKCGRGSPYYNWPDERKPIYCRKCKDAEMINVVSKRCEGYTSDNHPCLKHANYGFPGQSKRFCGKHKLPGMALPHKQPVIWIMPNMQNVDRVFRPERKIP